MSVYDCVCVCLCFAALEPCQISLRSVLYVNLMSMYVHTKMMNTVVMMPSCMHVVLRPLRETWSRFPLDLSVPSKFSAGVSYGHLRLMELTFEDILRVL